MRLSAYLVLIVATVVLYISAATYEIERAASVQWGLIKGAFDLLFLVPLELLAFSFLARLFNHPSQQVFGRLLKRGILPLLGIVALIGVGIIVIFFHALGGLPGVAH